MSQSLYTMRGIGIYAHERVSFLVEDHPGGRHHTHARAAQKAKEIYAEGDLRWKRYVVVRYDRGSCR